MSPTWSHLTGEVAETQKSEVTGLAQLARHNVDPGAGEIEQP